MAKDTIDIVTPMLTEKELDAFCSKYIIPTNLRPELPGHNKTIRNSTEGMIGIYTHFIECVTFHIPLSKFLLSVLEYYQINFSQLSVIATAKISHFEILCRVHEGQPTIDASICPIFIPWFEGRSVERDPLPFDDVVDIKLIDQLNEGRDVIRKYLEVFLSVVGLSRSFVWEDVRPTFLRPDNSEIGLLDFVKSTGPFKVKVGERTLGEGEILLSKETEDMVISPSRDIIRILDHTIVDELKSMAGKKKRRVVFNDGLPPVKKADVSLCVDNLYYQVFTIYILPTLPIN
ncbi:hypothetical protein Tco_0840285 [Tanacetum coccineum]|uniref:Uncharacterized protein n=1 Tax=Tanacetum coccineum TaxID=301880 RepID=A0ABQ5AX50_9ASTR